jgi:anti-anti-sigma factor
MRGVREREREANAAVSQGSDERDRTDSTAVDGITLRITTHDGSAVMRIGGELDLVSAPQLRNAIATVQADKLDELVLDLADLRYIDSVGIGLLVATRRRADAEGTRLVVRHTSPAVRRLLEMTGLVAYLGLDGS